MVILIDIKMSSDTPFSEYWLNTQSIFKSLPQEGLNRLEKVKICREYEKGEFIFKEA